MQYRFIFFLFFTLFLFQTWLHIQKQNGYDFDFWTDPSFKILCKNFHFATNSKHAQTCTSRFALYYTVLGKSDKLHSHNQKPTINYFPCDLYWVVLRTTLTRLNILSICQIIIIFFIFKSQRVNATVSKFALSLRPFRTISLFRSKFKFKTNYNINLRVSFLSHFHIGFEFALIFFIC